tara:strand:- start:378 stop:971 length:594 start_codon:yes stop_codon:yes gene_type:complete
MISYPARPTNGGPPHLRRPIPGKWIAQPKYNGWRALVHIPEDGSDPVVWNRHGELLSIADKFTEALATAKQRFAPGSWLDCEALERRGTVRGTLVVFDVFTENTAELELKFRLDDLHTPDLYLPWWHVPESAKLYVAAHIAMDLVDHACEHWKQINETIGETAFEGVVCKRLDSTYPVQTISAARKFPYWIKHRFDQ